MKAVEEYARAESLYARACDDSMKNDRTIEMVLRERERFVARGSDVRLDRRRLPQRAVVAHRAAYVLSHSCHSTC